MRIGIDFGTSYTAAAAVVDGKIKPVKFDGASQFRTAVYFPEQFPDLTNFSFDAKLERKMANVLSSLKKELKARNLELEARRAKIISEIKSPQEREAALEAIPKPIAKSDRQLTQMAAGIVRREWTDEETKRLASAPPSLERAIFGEAAIDAYIDDIGGNLMESPKSMIAYDFSPSVRAIVRNVIASVLERVRLAASAQFKSAVHEAVIGRPVVFRAADSSLGEARAKELMADAAEIAGFDGIVFVEEPIAASYPTHLDNSAREAFVLIDIGGGTTDVAFGFIGGDEDPEIKGTVGLAKGGTDTDRDLSLSEVMPWFGRGQDIPNHYFVEAASVHNFPAQKKFFGRDYSQWPAPYDRRLNRLASKPNTTLLNRKIEEAKVALSNEDASEVELEFMRGGKQVPRFKIQSSQLAVIMKRFVGDIKLLTQRADENLDCVPGLVILTGGMSRSPVIKEVVSVLYPHTRLVLANPSYAVVKGLAMIAASRG